MATKAPFSLVIPPLNKDSKAALLQAKNTRSPLKTLKPLGAWRGLGAETLPSFADDMCHTYRMPRLWADHVRMNSNAGAGEFEFE